MHVKKIGSFWGWTEVKYNFFVVKVFFYISKTKRLLLENSILYTKVEKFMIIARAPRLEPEARQGLQGAKAIRDFSTVVYILFFSLLDTSCHFLPVGMKIVYVNQWNRQQSFVARWRLFHYSPLVNNEKLFICHWANVEKRNFSVFYDNR
jgi:hypothetical protein